MNKHRIITFVKIPEITAFLQIHVVSETTDSFNEIRFINYHYYWLRT